MEMPTLNQLAAVYRLEDELNMAQHRIARKQKTFIGQLPIVRSRLDHRQLDLDIQLFRVDSAKTYLESLDKIERGEA